MYNTILVFPMFIDIFKPNTQIELSFGTQLIRLRRINLFGTFWIFIKRILISFSGCGPRRIHFSSTDWVCNEIEFLLGVTDGVYSAFCFGFSF